MSLTPVAYVVTYISKYDVLAINSAWFSEIREPVISEFDSKEYLFLTLLRPGFFLLSKSGGGGVDSTRALWQLITFKLLTLEIPCLLR